MQILEKDIDYYFAYSNQRLNSNAKKSIDALKISFFCIHILHIHILLPLISTISIHVFCFNKI